MSVGNQNNTRRRRVDSVGPVLSFTDSVVSLIEDSFNITAAERSQAGYTVYKVQFNVQTETPQGQPIIQECECWKRFSDFQSLAKALEQINLQLRLPILIKANYFDRFKESVIEERRQSALSFLQFTSREIQLSTSAPLINFMKGAAIVRILPINDLTFLRIPEGNTPPMIGRGSDNINTIGRGSDNIDTIGSDEVRMSSSLEHRNREESTGINGVETIQASSEDVSTAIGDVSTTTSDVSTAISDTVGLIRSDSVTVSQWGLEHTLKLRDEESNETAASGISNNKPSQLHLIVEDSDEATKQDHDLPLPSTPKTPEVSLIKKSQVSELGGSSWWSQALAQTNALDTEDYDSLIDKIDENSSKRYQLTAAVKDDIVDKNGVKTNQRSRSTSPQKPSVGGDKKTPSDGAYVVHAGKLITQGLEYEKLGQVEESFDLFKAGVDVLLNGVQTDANVSRREAVRLKTAEYLQYAEILQRKMIKQKQKAELVKMEANGNAKPHLLKDFKIINILASKVVLVESKLTTQKFIFKVLHKRLSPEEKKLYQSRIPRSKNRTPSQCPFMVKLLHHYETQSNRIFLLLEQVKSSQLVDHVQSIREHRLQRKRKKRRKNEKSPQQETTIETTETASEPTIESSSIQDTAGDSGLVIQETAASNEDNDQYMESLLKQLTSLSPPTSNLPTSSISTIGGQSEASEEEEDDELAMLRKEIEALDSNENVSALKEEETMETNNQEITIAQTSSNEEDGANTEIEVSEVNTEIASVEDVDNSESLDELERQFLAFTSEIPDNFEGNHDNNDLHSEETVMESDKNITTTEVHDTRRNIDTAGTDISTSTAETDHTNIEDITSVAIVTTTINIVPPTPTTPLSEPLPISSPSLEPITSPVDSSDSTRPSKSPSPINKEVKKSSGQTTPQFSPVVSLRNSPEPSLGPAKEWEIQLENDIKKWTAQIVVAIEHLHINGVICKDLQPHNLLLDDSGDIKLTYFGKWDYVPNTVNIQAVKQMYVAPELHGLGEVTASADWWSLGAILFELLTGKHLIDCHPGGVDTHIPLIIPGRVSPEGKSFLQQLLQVSPLERIGSGLSGIDDIKSHPFFHSINWNELYLQQK